MLCNCKSPIRVLHVINGLGSGGAESLIMNWYRYINRAKVQFDFLVRSRNNIYSSEIASLGGIVYYAPQFPEQWHKNFVYTKKFMEQHKYKIIHVHANALMYTYPLYIASKQCVPCRIMHSHNTSAAKKIYYPLHFINRFRIKNLANIYIACSQNAGKWMFGNKLNFYVLNNGINTDNFVFNTAIRNEYRKQLGIVDKLVIGNVAKFLPSKNHIFLLNIMAQIIKMEPESVMLLIGEGPEEEHIKNIAKKLGIFNHIQFLGVRKDVNNIMQAMDLFIFPSNFEGLGIVLIEAQVSGLPCLASDVIPLESKISQKIEYISLNKQADYWARKALQLWHRYSMNRSCSVVQTSSFDIKMIAEQLENLYINNFERMSIK